MKRFLYNIKYATLAGAVLLTLTGCGDFLQIKPKTFVSEDNFWNERTDIDQMVAGVYVKMQAEPFINRSIVWGELRSDNTAEGLDMVKNVDLYRVLKENLLSTNSYTSWTDYYAVINQCNTIIEMAPVVSEYDPTYTLSDVQATQAEMACLRDLCYFYLVRTFKDVPYYTYAVQSEDEVAPIAPTSGDQIVPALIADLEQNVGYALKAYPKDNNSAYNSNCNRVTQTAIYALLADLCLWNGDYQKCVDYAQKVIDYKYDQYQENYASTGGMSSGSVALFKNPDDTYSKGFPLYPCFQGTVYGNDFNQIFGGTQNSFESILELAYTSTGAGSNYLENSAVATLYGNYYSDKRRNDAHGLIAASEDLVSDVANSANGNIFDHRYDVRYYTSINNDKFKSGEFVDGYSSKYVNYGVNVTSSTDKLPFEPYFNVLPNVSNRNFIFYRLTDVMLLQAQALIELGSDTFVEEDGTETTKLDDNLNRAFYIIWAVNRRSIMTPSTSGTNANELKKVMYGTKAQLEELVLKERRRELLFEGKRWFDLLRLCHRDGNTTAIKNRVPAKGTGGGSNSLFTNYESLYWPYNKREVKNNPELSQKPYYGNDGEDDSFTSTK